MAKYNIDGDTAVEQLREMRIEEEQAAGELEPQERSRVGNGACTVSCPICGANCRCRKRGPGGICCSCHKHKARKVLESIMLTPAKDLSPEMQTALEQHLQRNEQQTLFDSKEGVS